MAAADDHGVPVGLGQLCDGHGEPDLAELGGDLVHEASWASASTATAVVPWTITGFSSISACGSFCSSTAIRAIGSGAIGVLQRLQGLGDAGRVGGERDDRDVVELLGVDAAGADDEHRHEPVAPDRDEHLGPARRHPLDEHGRAEAVGRRADRRLVVEVEDHAAVAGLVGDAERA